MSKTLDLAFQNYPQTPQRSHFGSRKFFLVSKMVVSPRRGEVLASVLDGIAMSFKSPSEAQEGDGLSSGPPRGPGGSVPRERRGSECGCHLAFRRTSRERTSRCSAGMEAIVKVVGRPRPFERVQQRTAEQAVSLDPCGRVQQQTVEPTVDLPLRPECSPLSNE